MPEARDRRKSSIDVVDDKASLLRAFCESPTPSWFEDVKSYTSRSPQQYLHSGDHLEYFAKYIGQDDGSQRISKSSYSPYQPKASLPYAILYDFNAPRQKQEQELCCSTDLDLLQKQTAKVGGRSQLLFMRGHPSPSWINSIGRAFEVDVHFLFHHVEQYSCKRADSAHTWPPLPSRGATQARFCLRTLGRHINPGAQCREEGYLQKLREKTKNAFEGYLDQVRRPGTARPGDSLLRDVCIHDGANFSLEQSMSVYTKETDQGWFALVWLDIGTNDLSVNAESKNWLKPLDEDPNNITFTPTATEMDPFNSDLPHHMPTSHSSMRQNGKHISQSYGAALEQLPARKYVLYALSGVLNFAAANENQFLNMMRELVRHDIRQASTSKVVKDDAALSNLLLNRDVLKQHVERLRDNVLVVAKWAGSIPAAEDGETTTAFDIGQNLLEKFQVLFRRAESLTAECDGGAQRVMNLVSHAEAKKQIAQAERLERLTQLAFIFIPASYTSSFFGMNFVELGQGSRSIWMYFVVTIPVVLMSLLLMMSRTGVMDRMLIWFDKRWKWKAGQRRVVAINSSTSY